jgi:hypothetical protein
VRSALVNYYAPNNTYLAYIVQQNETFYSITCLEFEVYKEIWTWRSFTRWKLSSQAAKPVDQIFGIFRGGTVETPTGVFTPYFWAFGYQYNSFMLTRYNATAGNVTHDYYWKDEAMEYY